MGNLQQAWFLQIPKFNLNLKQLGPYSKWKTSIYTQPSFVAAMYNLLDFFVGWAEGRISRSLLQHHPDYGLRGLWQVQAVG